MEGTDWISLSSLSIKMMQFLVVSLAVLTPVWALDNGLALTPPMGWMTWQRFRCITDCDKYPDECISENLIRRTADSLVSQGYLEAGYEYVIIDDCWMEHERDSDGNLVADRKRFPSGMKNLSDYVHAKGLKFGIYEDYGTKTCAGYPGVIDHMDQDAQLFADWGVDYVKLDGCYSDPETHPTGYPAFGASLNKTGRPIVYSCSWPAYADEPDYAAISKSCNLWRNYGDIGDSWNSMNSIANWFAGEQDEIVPFAGPGHWNDPDMLIIGNFGLTTDEAKSQMAIWAMLAAPLLMSNDLDKVLDEDKAVLLNKEVIAVNQDKLGIQGKRLYDKNYVAVWVRPISPKIGEFYTQAITVANRNDNGMPQELNLSLAEIGLNADAYIMEDLFEPENTKDSKPTATLNVRVNPSGAVMLRATPVDATGFLRH